MEANERKKLHELLDALIDLNVDPETKLVHMTIWKGLYCADPDVELMSRRCSYNSAVLLGISRGWNRCSLDDMVEYVKQGCKTINLDCDKEEERELTEAILEEVRRNASSKVDS